jgi:N-acetylmuramoyl-L-alanine amidase
MRLVEKQVTLQLSLALAAALRARGVDVVLTRVTDTLVALADRGRIANRSHGDLFISIHVNAANPAAPDAAQSRGFETYFLSEARTADALRVEQAENDAIRFEPEGGAAAGDPLRLVLAEMAQNEHLRESSKLAESVQRGLAGAHPGPSRGVKQAGFKVLVTAFMPAVLVEVGYGSQLEEATFLASSDGQRRIAVAIADATARYLTRYEGRIAAGGR